MNWSLSSYFPEFDGPEMQRFKAALKTDIASLRGQAATLPALDEAAAPAWEEVILKSEDIAKRLSHLGSYVGCLASADTCNEGYLKEEAALAAIRAEFSKVKIELLRALKDAREDAFASFSQRPALQEIAYYLSRLREDARRTMSPEKEILAADLGVDGIQAWGRLYDILSGRLHFEMRYPDGHSERVPMAQRRSLMERPDRRVRKAAFEGGNAAWQAIEEVPAAALNAISGTRLTLNRHRGVDHFLDVALFQAAITRKALDAMMEAIQTKLELPRRILRLKAKSMGAHAAAWYDLGAPLALPEAEPLPWEKGQSIVASSFARAYPALADFYLSARDKNWIEWEPGPGKRPGAFCTGSQLTKESRIFMTFHGALGDVFTLAHESGHGFHNHVTRDLRPYARSSPMTLAETASTFAEIILSSGMLSDPEISDAEKALILDMETGHAAIYLLDITVRYEFEKALYEERAEGELTVSRLKELMAQTQRRLFGDALDKGGEDPYFWASKLHFYITGLTFYNFPYTFGFLLSRGLYAIFKHEGAAFLPRYEEFLRLAGRDTAVNVVRQSIGRDLEALDFWLEAIESLAAPLDELEKLLPRVLPPEAP